MYNEEAKRKYLEDLEKTNLKKYVTNFEKDFEKTEKYEDEAEKDISLFSQEEIFSMFLKLNMRVSSLCSLTSHLRRYTLDTTGNIGAFSYRPEDIRELFYKSNNSLVTFSMMQSWLQKLINPLDCFILYGLFCGIKGPYYCELICSSMEDSDEATGLIWLSALNENSMELKGRQIHVDRQLFSYAKKASEASYYIQENCNGIKRKIPNERNGLLIFQNPLSAKKPASSLSSFSVKAKAINKLNTIFKKVEIPKEIKPMDVFYSGVVYNLKKLALEEGIEINYAEDYLRLQGLSKIEQQYNEKINLEFLKDKVGRYM